MRKVFSVAMLIVGTMIGAGFCSGRELVSFFGSRISIFVAPLCGACIFFVCVLFLSVGKAVRKRSFGEVNRLLLGRYRVVADVLLLCNNAIVLGAMIAGFDSLLSSVIPLPIAGIAAAVVCAFIAARGIGGMLDCNGIVVPVIIVSLIAVTVGCLKNGDLTSSFGTFSALTIPSAAVYVSMNMMLASTVLTTVGELTEKQILLSSLLASACITLLMTLLIFALNGMGNTSGEMPVLQMAASLGRGATIVLAVVMGISIFTTMLTAVGGISGYLQSVKCGTFFSCAVPVLFGAILSRLGFVRVISLFYPLVGVAGFFYLGVCLFYLRRGRKQKRSGAPRLRHKKKATE